MTDQILYKYRSADRVNDLRSRTIRLTPPGEFNDPFEALPAVGGAFTPATVERLAADAHSAAAADGVLLDGDEVRQHFGEIDAVARHEGAGIVRRLTHEMFGVVCLSKPRDNLLMWSHYADSHRGFAIGFHSDHEWFDSREYEEDPINHLVQVRYAHVRPTVFLADGLLEVHEDRTRLAAEIFLTKSSHWSYEKEWRLVRPLHTADSAGTPERPVHLLKFPPSAVAEVVCGLRMDYGARAALSEALDDQDYRHVRVRKTVLSSDAYSVDVVPA